MHISTSLKTKILGLKSQEPLKITFVIKSEGDTLYTTSFGLYNIIISLRPKFIDFLLQPLESCIAFGWKFKQWLLF